MNNTTNNNALSTFTFAPGMTLRTITKDGEPWFLGSDILTILFGRSQGMAWKYECLDSSDLSKAPSSDLHLGRGPARALISEAGLYTMILRSDIVTAVPFKKWVTSVVLPAIRKTGGYVMGEEKVKTGEMSMEEMTLKVMSFMQTKLASLEAERVVHIEKLETQQPAVEFVDKFLESGKSQTFTETAKILGLNPKVLTASLLDDRIVYRTFSGAPLLARQEYIDRKFFVVKYTRLPNGDTAIQTRITPSGVTWLSKRFSL